MPPRAMKRTKLAEPADSRESAQNGTHDKHIIFTEWARNRGVGINGVKPAKLPDRGLGLVTTRAFKTGERMLFVPEKAMYKPDAKLLKTHSLLRISPQAQLAISAMAMVKREESPLAVWQVTWPTMSDFMASMPLCWSHEKYEMLPPSVDQPRKRQFEDYHNDLMAVEKYISAQEWPEHEFRYFWMVINSRSFHWKPPKGKPGCMVLCPFIDYMNHGPSNTACNVFQSPSGYEVLADRDYAAGEEALATYGAHSNDKLLVHYGFVCASSADQPNIDDDIRLDHLLLPKLSESVRNQLRDVGFLGAYALLPASNELCFKTQVAVRAVLLTCNEWEYFVANGEDLGDDQTPAVRSFMEPLLSAYHTTAVDKLKLLASPDMHEDYKEVQVALLETRWMQIRDAIDAFLTA